MEIRIYNREMDFQGIIENQRSLLWNRKYNEAGDFELHTPITPYNVRSAGSTVFPTYFNMSYVLLLIMLHLLSD